MDVAEKFAELAETIDPPVCSDLDDECKDVRSPLRCWLYAPECGMCPLLATSQEE